MIKFEKVSFEEYRKAVVEYIESQHKFCDVDEDSLKREYEELKLPQRSTCRSAGYDFFAPFNMTIYTHDMPAYTYPTGIRFVTDREDIVLVCVPRSGLGFKFGLGLKNTLGVIDADYADSDNEGHIKVKMSADKPIAIEAGKAYMQGIIFPFIRTDDDLSIGIRNGGFGSTDYVVVQCNNLTGGKKYDKRNVCENS